MCRDPFISLCDSIRSKIGYGLSEILDLVREDLATGDVLSRIGTGKALRTYKEPKSIEGEHMMSSVSTPYDPSKEGPEFSRLG